MRYSHSWRPVPARNARRPSRRRPTTEGLETRCLLATTFTQTNLVSDIPGMARTTDPNLVNPWGLALGPNSAFWVADNHPARPPSTTATASRSRGRRPWSSPSRRPAAAGTSAPTGEVSNADAGFVVTVRRPSPARATSCSPPRTARSPAGAATWTRPTPSSRSTTRPRARSTRGSPWASTPTGTFLYATNFHAGTVDVFDSNFQPVHIPGAFTDSGIPAGYAPFGIQPSTASSTSPTPSRTPTRTTTSPAPGHGFIDVFDTEGHLLKRFASQGAAQLALGDGLGAVSGFGEFNNALLVGNFGDGTINAFDFDSGDFLGKLSDASGKPITIPGLWALQLRPRRRGGLAQHPVLHRRASTTSSTGSSASLTVNPSTPLRRQGPSCSTRTSRSPRSSPASTSRPTWRSSAPTTSSSWRRRPARSSTSSTGHRGPVQFVTRQAVAAEPAGQQRLRARAARHRARARTSRTNHGVYLYWTESSTGAVARPAVGNPTRRSRRGRPSRWATGWTASSGTRGADADVRQEHHRAARVPAGPRPAAAGQPQQRRDPVRSRRQALHQIGDNGRRGQLQNLPDGATGTGQADDQFGGPAPDDNHLTGVILRLNPDGTAPSRQPVRRRHGAQVAQLEQTSASPSPRPSSPRSWRTSRRSSPTAAATASGSPSTR